MKRLVLTLAMAALTALAIADAARGDAVTDWNRHAVGALVDTAGQSPTVSTVHLAMVHGAVYDAVNSIDDRYEPYLVAVRTRGSYSRDAAAATAAYKVLLALVPAQAPALSAQYELSMAAIKPGPARDGGVRVGEIAAAAMLAERAGDGRDGAYRFPAPASPTDPWPVGRWRPVLPSFGNDPGAWVKDVRPFLVEDVKRFNTRGPFPLSSPGYARDFDEIKAIGALNSKNRTADQTDQARFWAEGPQPFTRAARRLAAEQRLRAVDSARMFAMLYMTAADAAVATWQDKSRWLFWRPITAIREADRDDNPKTKPDPGWLPLINTPPYPDHPSGLSSLGAAMAVSLDRVFGPRLKVTMDSTTSGTKRSYRGFMAAADEIVDARVYSGIHFRKADDDGLKLGADIARAGLSRHFGR